MSIYGICISHNKLIMPPRLKYHRDEASNPEYPEVVEFDGWLIRSKEVLEKIGF